MGLDDVVFSRKTIEQVFLTLLTDYVHVVILALFVVKYLCKACFDIQLSVSQNEHHFREFYFKFREGHYTRIF
jgi:hypothetical protein